MVQNLLIFSVLFSGQFAAASCGGNFLAPETAAELTTIATRAAVNEGLNISPELRAVLLRWMPEFYNDDLKSILPDMKRDMRLEDKVVSPKGLGLTVLRLREQALALIKWERHPIYGGPEYTVASAMPMIERGPLTLRKYLLDKQKRVDPWGTLVTLPAGFALFEGGRYSLDASSPENLVEIEQQEVLRIVYGNALVESNRIGVLRAPDGTLTLSVRRGASTGEQQMWQFAQDQGERAVEKIMRELSFSPKPYTLESTEIFSLYVPYEKPPMLKVVNYSRNGSETVKLLIVADDKSHDPNFPGWPLFNTEQALRAISARITKELVQ